jgi:hypothetical protein
VKPELSVREVAALFFAVAVIAHDNRSLGEVFESAFDHADAFLSEVKRRRKKTKRG